jgi:16S rRNA (cytosine967-C5)-methyltransferase
MKPAARLKGAIDILRAITLDHIAPEKALLDWGRSHRFAGSSDRRAIHDTVYDVLRYYGILTHYMSSFEPAYLVAGWLFFIKEQPLTMVFDFFSGEHHAPKELPDDIIECLCHNKQHPVSFETKYNVHASLEPLFQESLGDKLDLILSSLTPRAPLDIRVNQVYLQTKQALDILENDFQQTKFETNDNIPTLIRTYDYLNITLCDLYQEGKIDIQDGAAQFVCHLISKKFQDTLYILDIPLSQARILDYCAGGGGKTVAIADLLNNNLEIVGSDISEIRLKSLKDRAIRSGNKKIRIIANHRLSPEKGLFNMVMVDSPCSGSGTWRRNIYDKWITSPQKVTEYQQKQQEIIQQASHFVEDNGLLIYMTCSLFVHENDYVIADFMQKNTNFTIIPLTDTMLGTITNYGLSLNPAQDNVDGFYISIMQKTK